MSGANSEHAEEEAAPAEEENEGCYLEIGDVVLITRMQDISSTAKSPRDRREASPRAMSEGDSRSILFTLTAEGIADPKVSGIVADDWLQHPHLCLFMIETPSTVFDDTAPAEETVLEGKANKAGFEKSQGDVLKFGQEVQLRHIHSNRLLSLNLLAAANAPGAWSVSVNNPNDFLCRQITLLPFNRSHNIGDPIKYGEPTSIVFQTDNLKYYLQSEIIQEDLLDINSTHKPAKWQFLRYEPHDVSKEALRFGQTFTIKYPKLGMYMALKSQTGGAKSSGKKTPPLFRSLKTLPLADEPEEPREPMVTKTEVEDFSNYWVIQNVNILEGGCVSWKSRFHIKNALTGGFLGPSLQLTPRPDPTFYFCFPKPDSFNDESLIPNGYPLQIKSAGDFVLSPDSRKANEEALDHLVPHSESEGVKESGEISLALETLGGDKRESMFELKYVDERDGPFFYLITGLFPKFIETKAMVEDFKAKCEGSAKKSWEVVEALERRLDMMESALENVTQSIRQAAGGELESKQKIFTGLGFHSILIELASILQTLFDSYAAREMATELLIDLVRVNLESIWNLLNDVVLENEISATKVAEHQAYLCELLKYDTRRIGALLTEVFRLVDPEIKDPKIFYHQWCSRLDSLSKRNLQEQVIYMRIIRNLCEIGDSGVLEYQREITRNLFSSEIAIDLVVFSQINGEVAVHFGEKGGAVSAEEFKILNPDLAPFLKDNAQGQAIILLRELSGLEDYVEYVQTALMLYHAVCRGRCFQAREYLEKRLRISVSMAMAVSQDLNIHMDIRQACLFLLEALCISVPPYECYSDNDTSFNYAEIKMQQMKEEDTNTEKLIDYPARKAEVNMSMEIVFKFWMSKTMPDAIRTKDPAEPNEQKEYYSPMKYLMSMLRLTLAIVEYKHSTELYAQCVLKATQYILAGFTRSAHLYKENHWGSTLVAQAVKAGEGERRLKIIVNEILSAVLNVLLAIKKVSRRTALTQVIALFITEAGNLKNPFYGTGVGNTKEILSAKLKNVINPERSDKMISDYLKKKDKKKPKGSSSALAEPLLVDEAKRLFNPGFDFKDVTSKAPPVKEIFIRVILEWPSFSSQLKEKVIDVMDEIFKENMLFDKALKSSDVISLGPISQIFNRLRWLKDNSELSSLIVRAKFEISMTGKSSSLSHIIHLLEYLMNFCHPRNSSNDFVMKKSQNIVRQLELHRDVNILWQLIFHLDKIGKGTDSPCIMLKSALIGFFYHFINKNRTNTREMGKLLKPNMRTMTVVQFPSLLRLINDYGHLAIKDVTRLLVYILDDIQSSDRNLNSMVFFEKMMMDTTGMLKRNIQNVASSLLSEKLNSAMSVRKERPQYVSSLLENLALSAEDNTPVITQCRHLLPLSNLQGMLLEEDNPLLLSALLYFLFAVYVKKAPDVKTLEKVADVSELLEHVLKHATTNMQNPNELLPLVIEGSYGLVFFTSNPAYTDIHINLPSTSPELAKWVFLCKEWDGRLTGVFKTIPDILDVVELDMSMVPTLTGFYYALAECRTKIERMAEQTEGLLTFTPLLNVFRETGTRFKKCLDTLQVELSDEAVAVAKGDSYAIPPEAREQLQAALKGSLPFIIDQKALENLDVDQSMSSIMKSGYGLFAETFAMESEDDYINSIVQMIDTRLANGHLITNKKDIKDLIASLAKKVRGLQKLFTSSKQRTLLFKILQGIVPEEEYAKFKITLNPLFTELKLMDYAVLAILRNEAHEEVIAALSFLQKLFLMQSPDFMEKFREGLNENSQAYYLFMKMQQELINGKAHILEGESVARSRKSSSAATPMLQVVGNMVKTRKPQQSAESSRQQELLVNMLGLIQICCDNCNEPFQIFYREQQNSEGKADVDLVNALAAFLIDIRAVHEYIFSNDTVFVTLNAALHAFVDFVTGPCVTNQLILGNNVRIYLVMNTLISQCQGKQEQPLIDIHANCIKFLTCLLEGHPDESVYETMQKFLDLKMLRESCESIYQRLVVGHEDDISLELSSIAPEYMGVVEVALGQAILLLKLRMVGVMHDELTQFERPVTDKAYCFGFFARYIGYVEIDRNGVLESHLFPIPWKCKYITASTRDSLIVNVNRNSPQEKIEDFMHQVPLCQREMVHQQMLNCSKTFKALSSKWQLFGKISYYIALTINTVLLLSVVQPDFSDLKDNLLAFSAIAILGLMQLFTYMACFFFNIIEYYPQTIQKGMPQPKDLEMESFSKVENSDSQLMNFAHEAMQSGVTKDYATMLQGKLKDVLFNFDMYYTYAYFMVSIIAIYEPVFYPFVLVDMVRQTPELSNVLKAVTHPFRQLILTLWLGVIIIYLFSIGSFVYYSTAYSEDTGVYCHDLWNCFFSTLNVGIRTDGGHMDTPGEEDYWSRMMFDMMFYVIISIILLNIIFGIIIDTFSELRDGRSQVIDDIHNRCYICGVDRSVIESKGTSWSYHFMCEHSPFAYMSFLIYISEKKVYECSGLEKLVKECYDSMDTGFMPKTSIAMGELSEGEEEEEE